MKLSTLIAAVLMGCALAFYSQGCVDVSSTTVCPPTAVGVSFSVSGNNAGTQALTMLGAAGHAAGMMAKDAAPTQPLSTVTLNYKSLAAFGPEGGATGCVMPPQTTVVVTSPPASIVTH